MKALIRSNSIIIKGLSTHVYARSVIDVLRDVLEVRGRVIKFFIEGSPKPLGEGITIKVLISDELSEGELRSVESCLKLMGFRISS